MFDEDDLYEILFRSISPIAKQFKKEIKAWLRATRLEQNIIKDNMLKELKEENSTLKDKVNVLEEEKRLELLAKNNTHRITWYKQKETNELLFAVSYLKEHRA